LLASVPPRRLHPSGPGTHPWRATGGASAHTLLWADRQVKWDPMNAP